MDYLAHHGIKGMRWGYRRWQNPDGTLTEEGKKHYGKGLAKVVKTHREKEIRSTKQDIADYDSALRDPQLRQKLSAAKANAQSDLAAYETAASNAKIYREKADNSITFIGNWMNDRRANKAEAEAKEAYENRIHSQSYFDEIKAEIANLSYGKIAAQNEFNSRSESFIQRYSQEEYDKIFKK